MRTNDSEPCMELPLPLDLHDRNVLRSFNYTDYTQQIAVRLTRLLVKQVTFLSLQQKTKFTDNKLK